MKKQVFRILKSPLFVIFLMVLLLYAYCYFVMPRHITDPKLRPRYSLSRPVSFDYNFLLNKTHAGENVCVLVTTDDESMAKVDSYPPIWKEQFAATIKKISECGPKVIISDLMIWRSEDNKVIAEAMKKSGNVILGYLYKNGGSRFLDEGIKESAYAIGATDIISTPTDDPIMTFYIYEPGTEQIPTNLSMPIKAAFLYRNVPLENEKISIPTTELDSNEFLIHYQYEEGDIPVVSIGRIMEGNFDKRLLRNKVVILSSEPYSTYEKMYNAPVGSVSEGVIMANIINSVVYSNFLRPVPYELNIGIMCIVALLLALLFYRNTTRNGFIILIFIVLFSVGMSFWLLARNIYWSYFDMVAFSIISYAAVQSYKTIVSRLGQKLLKK